MSEREEVLIEELARTSDEFRRLLDDHRRYEEQLRDLDRKAYLTPAEEMERKRLQKVKLAGKDRMAAMLSAYRAERGAASPV